jgi:hypothetical protein
MTYNQRNIGDAWRAILAIIAAMLICLCITLLSGCRTRYITQEVPVVLHDRDSVVSVQHIHTHDTLMMRDSVTTFIKGDTIRIERWHTLQAVNYIARIDTLWRERIVEQPVEVKTTEVREVNRLKWWQTALMWCGAFAIGIGGGLLYWKFRRK